MDIHPLESRFDSYQAYRNAVDTVVHLARHELAIFESDLQETCLESRAGSNRLTLFLTANHDKQLRIVLHRTEHVERHCPRLMGLLKTYGHIASLRHSPENLRHLADCFVVADSRHAAIRFHADHARGKLLLAHDEEARSWQGRFDELWELSMPMSCMANLGL